jgi:hypothetical protein
MPEQLIQLTSARALAGSAAPERQRLERRARILALGGNGWHVIEFAIALGASIAAGCVAHEGFGIDSLIEMLAGASLSGFSVAGAAPLCWRSVELSSR